MTSSALLFAGVIRRMSAKRPSRAVQNSDDALAALRATLSRHQGGKADLGDLKVPLRTFCECARREEMPPERVIIAVKRVLDEFPAQQPDARAANELRSRAVTLAIDLFYSKAESDGERVAQ